MKGYTDFLCDSGVSNPRDDTPVDPRARKVATDVIEPKAAKEHINSDAELPNNFWHVLEGGTYGRLIVLKWTDARKGKLLSIRDSLCSYFSPFNLFIRYSTTFFASLGFRPCAGIGGKAGSIFRGFRMNCANSPSLPSYFGKMSL